MYLYDEESRLREVQKAIGGDPLLTIEYDALGRRVRSTDATTALTTYHVYGQGLEVVEELTCAAGSQNCTPTLAREFVYGRDFLEPVTMIDWTAAGQKPAGVAEILHYLQDALGSIVALTNPAAQEVFPAAPGRVVERYTYDPYGRTLIEKCNQSTGLPVERLAASRFDNSFAWTGQRYDAGVRLYHFLHRGYSPRLGRWLQRDPLGYVDGVSLYEYVASQPTGWIDPLGLCAGPPPPFLPRRPVPKRDPTPPGTSQPSSGPTTRPKLWTPQYPLAPPPRPEDDWAPLAPPGSSPWDRTKEMGRNEWGVPDGPGNWCTNANDKPGGFDFGPACQAHDQCYATLDKSKDLCDTEFFWAMIAICQNQYGGDPSCLNYAWSYWWAVHSYGQDAYDQSQREAEQDARHKGADSPSTSKPTSQPRSGEPQ